MARCTGHSRRSGQPCRNNAINGATVCRNHGGSAPQVRAAAARRLVEAEAEGLLSKHGPAEPVTDPLQSLLMIAGRSERLIKVLEERVDELATIRYENAVGGEQLRAEIGAYMTMLDRCRVVLVDLIKLDIWDRLAKVEEQQVALFVKALEAAMTDAGLAEKVAEVKSNVARHLRIVAS